MTAPSRDAGPNPTGPAIPTTGVLFDLDGTLIDSRYAIIDSYRATFETELGRPLPARLEDPSAIMAPRPHEVFAEYSDSDPAALEAAYGQHYVSGAYRRVTAYPSLLETLSAIMDRGITVGIVTNKRLTRMLKDFEFLGIDPDLFACLVTADDTAERKPHPTPVLLGLARCGLDAETSWYVGDGPQDVLAGAAAGTRTAGAAYGYYGKSRLTEHNPDHVLDSLTDLLEII